MLYNLNEENITLSLIGISIIGGTVNYFIDCTSNKLDGRGFTFFLGQVLVAGFTGFLGGLICIEYKLSPIMTLFISGVAGGEKMGTLLKEIQMRFFSIIKK
jgi:hypothetical protein